MASKFDKAKSAQSVKEIAKKSNEKANLITIKYYKDEDLLDYPRNNEDVSNTEDIEKSISEQGFTDPMEITDFGADEGKYYILSGHRRRVAGRKQGMTEFPCIVRHFKNANEVYNYVLYANSTRDSAKDPLLLASRYKMHEEYLKECGFKGSIAEEVAARLGLGKAQADRYKQMNKVILPIWDLIREGKVGMSSITDSGLYTHSPREQEEILTIFNECLDNGVELTRTMASKIVKAYRDGKRTWLEVIQTELKFDDHSQGVSVMNINSDPEDQKERERSPLDRNNEVNYDFSHREESGDGNNDYAEERLSKDDYEAIEKAEANDKGSKSELSDEEKKNHAGKKIMKNLADLNNLLTDFYEFEDMKAAMKSMSDTLMVMLNEMEDMAAENDLQNMFKEQMLNVKNFLKRVK